MPICTDAATGIYGGSYSFAPNQTNNGSSGGNSLASFILGNISGYSNTPSPVPGYYRWQYYASYFQDDIKIRRDLTLVSGFGALSVGPVVALRTKSYAWCSTAERCASTVT